MNSFLLKLHEKVPLKEGPEGYRLILREIYRAGTISISDLSFKTTMPIPVLAKAVNFLIETETLSRIPEGVLYTENGMQFIESELNFYGYGISSCSECDGHIVYISPRWEDLLDILERKFVERPTVDTTLDQAFAEPETALRRAMYLYQAGCLEGRSVCFLGDDDYTSVAVALLYNAFYPEEPKLIPKHISVIDVDSRLLDGIKKAINQNSFNIHYVQWDYREPVPSSLENKFDLIVVDPPYSENGLKLVLSRCISLLETQEGGEIFLSFAHRPILEMMKIQKLITDMGLVIKTIIPRFNRYEGAQILGNSTQVFHLVCSGHMNPLVKSRDYFKDPIYTNELNPTFRIYLCQSCNKVINVGSGFEIPTIEILKAKGCPFCAKSTSFILEGKKNLSPE